MRKTYLFAVLAMFGSLSEAKSQQPNVSRSYLDNYFVFGVGLVLPSNNDMTITGSLFGKSASASGSIEYDTGVAFSATYGKKIFPLVSLEGEFNYTGAKISGFSGAYTIGSSSESGKSSLSGSIDTFSTLTNLVFSPFPSERFSPYVGIGVGVGLMLTTIDKIGANDVGATIPAPYVAANFIGGINFNLTPNIDMGVRYQLMMMTPGGDGGVSAANISLTNSDMHQFKGTLTFRF